MQIKREIHRIRFLKNVKEDDLVINIDECNVSQDTHSHKSWILKGKRISLEFEFYTHNFNYFLNLKWWLEFLLYSLELNQLSKVYRILIKFKEIYSKKWRINKRIVIILLDNASFYTAKQTIEFLKKNFSDSVFITQYSPQNAPVENFFSILKSKLCTQAKGLSVNFPSSKWIKRVEEWLNKIKVKEILNI